MNLSVVATIHRYPLVLALRLLVRVLLGRQLQGAVEHFLEMALLDRQSPVGELAQLVDAGPLVELGDNRQ
jgi:hypothetical protein